jgi:pSer/pThr/pTyr-binding forkhead associated (FHA) protein
MQVWLEINLSEVQRSVLDITDKSIITIGRSKSRDIILPIPTISRNQCDIRRYKSQKMEAFWILFDGYFDTEGKIILPKNPTMINGRMYLDFREAKLSHQDCIIFSKSKEYPNIIFNNIGDKKSEVKARDTNPGDT